MLMPERVTYWRVRTCLQEGGFSRFFENIVKIIGTLTKRSPVTLSEDQRSELIQRFLEIQEPFEKHKGSRKNFLSYAYVTYKFSELLGYHEFLSYLPLLKAAQNLISADRIWGLICNELRYEYIPTDPDQQNALSLAKARHGGR